MNEDYSMEELLVFKMNALDSYKPGTVEYESTLATIKTLSDCLTNKDKADNEAAAKAAEQKAIDEREKKKMLFELGKWLTSTGLSIWTVCRVTKFEDVGAITSKAFQFLPKKLW